MLCARILVNLVDESIHRQDQRSDFSSQTLELTLARRDYICSRLNKLIDTVTPGEAPSANLRPIRRIYGQRTGVNLFLTIAISRHARLIRGICQGTSGADLLRYSGNVRQCADLLSCFVLFRPDCTPSANDRAIRCPSRTSLRGNTLLPSIGSGGSGAASIAVSLILVTLLKSVFNTGSVGFTDIASQIKQYT
jgi:hypothetical protein